MNKSTSLCLQVYAGFPIDDIDQIAKYCLPCLSLRVCAAVELDMVLDSLYQSLSLIQQYSVLTLGQTTVYPGAVQCNSANTTAGLVPCTPPKLLPKAYQNITFPKA